MAFLMMFSNAADQLAVAHHLDRGQLTDLQRTAACPGFEHPVVGKVSHQDIKGDLLQVERTDVSLGAGGWTSSLTRTDSRSMPFDAQ